MKLEGTCSGKDLLKYQSPGADLSKGVYKDFLEDLLIEMRETEEKVQQLFDFLSQFSRLLEVSQYIFNDWDELLGVAYDNNLTVGLKASYTIFHEVKHIDRPVGYAINSEEYGRRMVIDSRYLLKG